MTSNPQDQKFEWLDEVLNTHRAETWRNGWNGTTEKAKAAIIVRFIELEQQHQAELLRARIDELHDSIITLSQTDWGRSAMIKHQYEQELKLKAELAKITGGEAQTAVKLLDI